MKFILGTKVNMTQIFDDKGIVHPVTVLKVGPMVVTAIKTVSTDGYNAIQVGFGEKAEKNINKPEKGHMKEGNFRFLREFRTEGEPEMKVGDTIDLSTFSAGEEVVVSSTSKGKGFQGVVKRHGFKGGPRSHGQKHSEREPGSIGGAGRDGGRVAKGKRMAGRMGGDRITTKGLKIVSVKPETGEIFVRGAIAGRRGTLVEVISL
ncbi:MAG: 50S ribosomal protein L3 [Parcubacteria group bacterium GW2011_GWB1_40_5]|nr:MAG: 50S ribosomal protein L3 [Parcubacteria group bacterium GW2011_GWB1_40_5]